MKTVIKTFKQASKTDKAILIIVLSWILLMISLTIIGFVFSYDHINKYL